MKISVSKFNERIDKFYRLKVLGKMEKWYTQFGAAFFLGAGAVTVDNFREAFKATRILVEQKNEAGAVVGEEIDVDRLNAALEEAFTAVPEIKIERKFRLLGSEYDFRFGFTKDDAKALYAELTAA